MCCLLLTPSQTMPALCIASYYGHFAVIEALLKIPGIDVNRGSERVRCTIFAVAASDATDLPQLGWTALHWACSKGHMAAVQALLADSRVEVNTRSKVRELLPILLIQLIEGVSARTHCA